MKKIIATKRPISTWIVCLIGIGTSLLLLIGGAAITGSLLLNEMVSLTMLGAVTKSFLFLAMLAGVLVALNISDNPIVTIAAVVTSAVILLQLLMCAFIFDGLNGAVFINSLVLFAGAVVGVFLKMKRRSKIKIRKKRYR